MLQAAPPSPQQEAYENLRGQAAPPTQSGWSGITAQPKPSLEQEAYQNLVAEQAGANVNWDGPAQPRPSPEQEAYQNLAGQAGANANWANPAQPKPSLEQEAYQNLVAEQAGANVNWDGPAQPRPSPQQEAYQNLAGQAAPNPAANVTWPRGNARRRPYGYRPGLAAGNLARLQPGYGSSYAY
jgi:hypothetical protein